MTEQKIKKGIIIPQQKISPEALEGLIEEFVLREGTDYGQSDCSLEQKKKQIYSQLNLKHIVILFDPDLESTTLMTQDQLQKLSSQNFDILSSP